MKEDLTDLIIIMDRSGSMSSIQQDMEGGLDQLFTDQRKEPGECQVTLVQFDDEHELVYEAKPLADVPPTKLVPRGTTALLDAMGFTIRRTGERLAALPEAERPGKVIVVIVTDGHENASKEYQPSAGGRERIAAMVKEQEEKYSWTFVYLGANQDAFEVGGSIGVRCAANYVADSVGVKGLYKDVTKGVSRVRGGGKW